jgi:hypothetical protein
MSEHVIDKWRVVRGPVCAAPGGQFAAYLDVYAADDAARAHKLHKLTVQFDGTAAGFRAALAVKVAKLGNAAIDAAETAVEAGLSQLARGE